MIKSISNSHGHCQPSFCCHTGAQKTFLLGCGEGLSSYSSPGPSNFSRNLGVVRVPGNKPTVHFSTSGNFHDSSALAGKEPQGQQVRKGAVEPWVQGLTGERGGGVQSSVKQRRKACSLLACLLLPYQGYTFEYQPECGPCLHAA